MALKREALLQLVRGGLSLNKSLKALKIPDGTIYDWRKRDPDLQLDIEQARALYVQDMLAKVNADAEVNPSRAEWLLKCNDRETYGDNQKVTHLFDNVDAHQAFARVLAESTIDESTAIAMVEKFSGYLKDAGSSE